MNLRQKPKGFKFPGLKIPDIGTVVSQDGIPVALISNITYSIVRDKASIFSISTEDQQTIADQRRVGSFILSDVDRPKAYDGPFTISVYMYENDVRSVMHFLAAEILIEYGKGSLLTAPIGPQQTFVCRTVLGFRPAEDSMLKI